MDAGYAKVEIPEGLRTETKDELAKRTARYSGRNGGQFVSFRDSDPAVGSGEDAD